MKVCFLNENNVQKNLFLFDVYVLGFSLVRSTAHGVWGWDYDVSLLSLLDHYNKLLSFPLSGEGVGIADCLGGPQSLLSQCIEYSFKWGTGTTD